MTAAQSVPNPAPRPATSADLIMSQASNGNYEIYDIGDNTALAAYPLTNIASPWQPARHEPVDQPALDAASVD